MKSRNQRGFNFTCDRSSKIIASMTSGYCAKAASHFNAISASAPGSLSSAEATGGETSERGTRGRKKVRERNRESLCQIPHPIWPLTGGGHLLL